MTEISDSELDSRENQIRDTSHYENFYKNFLDLDIFDSGTSDSHQGDEEEKEEEKEEEEDYSACQDFNDFIDTQDNNQNSAPCPLREVNFEGLTLNSPDCELAEDETLPASFVNFPVLPEELQRVIWHFSALQTRRNIVMDLRQDTFRFETHPSTPTLMHVCRQARKYGLEYFYAVDAEGVLHDFTDPQQADKPYFYVSPISDDFILKFGEETFCPWPAYCPVQFSSEYMQQELAIEERKLYELDTAEDRDRTRPIPRVRARRPALVHNAPAYSPLHAPAGGMQFYQQILQQVSAGVLPDPPQPGEPVFPPVSVLPHFFDNIRSAGIHLSLRYSECPRFEGLTAAQVQQWAEEKVKHKFETVLTKILDRLPQLEHTFMVVRAYGKSNRCVPYRGPARELEKKEWTSVGMASGRARCMGYREFEQFEDQAKVWIMHERVNKGMRGIDFELYVQIDILWEI
ncbi:hypothetical protein EAE96_002049 [Botrytis aclada]|nr:hypothetical protein EAE96_002049 [Botrytis aclada]